MNKQKCSKCGHSFFSFWLKNGKCRGCLYPELVVECRTTSKLTGGNKASIDGVLHIIFKRRVALLARTKQEGYSDAAISEAWNEASILDELGDVIGELDRQGLSDEFLNKNYFQ